MEIVWEYRHLFLAGTLVTLEVTAVASLVMVVVALAAGLARLSPFAPLRWLATVYVEIFRGTSLYVQLFWIYFALPLFGVTLPARMAAYLGLGLCLGAYGAEVVRAAVLAVPRTQIEAALALNFTRFERMRRVVLPQALRAALPPFNNLTIELLKGSSLVALITVPDLTFQARLVNLRTLETLASFGVVLLVYLAIAQAITFGFRRLERRLAFGRVTVG